MTTYPSKHILYKQLDGTYTHADRVYIDNVSDIIPKTAFSEVATSSPGDTLYINFPYHISSGLCITSGIGVPVFSQASGMAIVSTSTSGTGKAILRTKRVLPYVPGQATHIRLNGYFSSGVGAQKQLLGYGDDLDGYFFGVSGASFGIWARSFGNETFISQSGWSENKFDGTLGQSDRIDFTKGNAFAMKYPCICFGEVQFFVADPNTGKSTLVHKQNNFNNATVPAIGIPALPLRAEVDNNGETTPASINIVSMYVARYGHEPDFATFSASGYASTSGSTVHALTISGAATFKGYDNRKTTALNFLSVGVNGNAEVIFELYKNLPITATSMQMVDGNDSSMYYTIEAALPALSGAIAGSLCTRNSAVNVQFKENNVRLYAGETITVVARATAGSTIPVTVFLNWKEYI